MPPRREIDPDPVLRTVRTYTGAEFEGQLLNRGRGEQMEGVDIVNARDDSREPQRTVEQPGLRPVSATPPAAGAHAQGSAPPVPTRQSNQAGSPNPITGLDRFQTLREQSTRVASFTGGHAPKEIRVSDISYVKRASTAFTTAIFSPAAPV